MNDSAGNNRFAPLPRLSDLVGQNTIRQRLAAAVKTAQSGAASVPHILFDGPAGLGKRTFAETIARELEGGWTEVSGAELKQIKDVIPCLSNAANNSVIFIDGIDRLPSNAVAEYLASAMRDFSIPVTYGEGGKERTINFNLKRFTLIGTALETDRVNPLLLERFGIRGHFGYYTHGELSVLIRRAAAGLKVTIDDNAVSEIARRSGGMPGRAADLTRAVRDYAETRNEERISLRHFDDPLYEEAVSFIIAQRRASTSLLQRKFAIGYGRAAKIMDEMESQGIISAKGTNDVKPRDVLISLEQWNKMNAGGPDKKNDPLYKNAVNLVLSTGKASVTLLQRCLDIEYGHAVKLLEQMKTEGVVWSESWTETVTRYYVLGRGEHGDGQRGSDTGPGK